MKHISKPLSLTPAARKRGFTLIELLAVIVILGLLASLSVPVWKNISEKADSMVCASNLRQIGTAINSAVQDNNGYYPNIEPDPTNPIYQPEDNAQTLPQVLQPYNITGKGLSCPADVKSVNYFAQKGTSYMWRPLVDGEPEASPTIIFRQGVIIHPSLSRIRLVVDFDSVHRGRQNAVFADGHVKVY